MQIFISYKREDETFARQLSGQLQTWGYESWLDVERISPGEDWDAAIHRGLQASDMVLGVLTPKSVASVNVLDEWGWALSNNKPLIPLKLEETPPADIPPRYIRAQYIDFTQDPKTAFDRLKARLINPVTLYQSPTGNSHAPVPATADWDAEPKDNRGRMLKNVYDFWIKGVLDNVLRENQGFELGLDTAPGAVLQHRDYGNYVLPGSASIGQVFEDMNRELLILGAPGAGKTILLLQLARQLLEQARGDETFPMPVVFNLSSWAAERKPLAEWLAASLFLSYSVPKKVAKAWVEGEKLLLLLDGLDEVAGEYRDDCVEAINQFKRHYRMVDVTVCSRIEEYAALTGKLDLQGAVTLRPLTGAQIQAYIADDSLKGLRETLRTDPALAAMAQTPFLLNCMATAYQEKSEIALRLPTGADSQPARRKHLFDAYTEHQLQHSDHSDYAPAAIRHYLAWLARQMVVHQQSIFHMEGLQDDWLHDIHTHSITRIVNVLFCIFNDIIIGFIIGILVGKLIYIMTGGPAGGLVIGLIGGLVVWLLFRRLGLGGLAVFLFWGAVVGLVIGLGGGLAGGLVGGLVGGLAWDRGNYSVVITPIEDSWEMVGDLLVGLSVGLIVGVTVGVIVGVILGVIVGVAGKLTVGSEGSVIDTLVGGLAGGLVVGLVGGLVSGLVIGQRFGSAQFGRKIQSHTHPNEGISRSLRNALLTGLVGGVLVMPIGFFVGGVEQGVCLYNLSACSLEYFHWILGWSNASASILAGLLAFMATGLIYGGRVVILHSTIRYLLWRRGLAPRNYAAFLDHAASLHILRKVGGGYIFIHRYLLEYFAELETE